MMEEGTTFSSRNKVQIDDSAYNFNEPEYEKLLDAKPWMKKYI